MLTLRVLDALLNVIAETPDGAPAGILYAGLMDRVSLPEFDKALALFDEHGLVRRSGDLLYPTAKLTDAYEAARKEALAR